MVGQHLWLFMLLDLAAISEQYINIGRIKQTAYPPSSSQRNSFSLVSSQTDSESIRDLLARIERLEKSSLSKSKASSSPIDNLFESLAFNQLALNARTVEVCSIAGMSLAGCFVGWSLLDRLWLLGGILAGWWASGAVHRDSRGGSVCRRIGVLLAQLIRDGQEKYQQAIIFYRTGRLAYESSRLWDQVDREYGIGSRIADMKRAAMTRFTSFNTAFAEYQLADQLADAWNVIVAKPFELFLFDTDPFLSFFFEDSKSRKNHNYKGRYMFSSNLRRRLGMKPDMLYRPSVNPWAHPFASLRNRNKKNNKKKPKK